MSVTLAMASAHYLVSLPDLDISNPRKTSMVRASSSSTKNTTSSSSSSSLPLAFASSIPIKACKISFFSKRSRKFAIKATENLPNSEATLAADAFSKFKHMLLPVTDRNPYLSEGTRQAVATTADLAKKYGADITVVVIDENPIESLPEHNTHLSSIRWHLSEGGFQEFRLIERLGSGSKPTAIIGEVADDLNMDLVVISMEAIHSKHIDANLLAEFIPCPVLLLPL